MSALLAYEWPGNIRQLANALTFAEAICEAGNITVHHLPEECVAYRCQSDSQSTPIQPSTPHNVSLNMEECDYQQPEKQMLLDALRYHRWNISAVAKYSKVSRPTVYHRMKKYNIILPKDILN